MVGTEENRHIRRRNSSLAVGLADEVMDGPQKPQSESRSVDLYGVQFVSAAVVAAVRMDTLSASATLQQFIEGLPDVMICVCHKCCTG